MNRTTNNMKKAQNNGYSEVSRFRSGAAIAACLAIAVTGIVGAKAIFGSKNGTEKNTAGTMQAAAQLPTQAASRPASIEQNKPGHSVAHIDITPDEIFSMSIEELKELSGYEYDIVESKWSPQHECYGYRFAAFPEYVCAIDAFQNPDENTIIDSYHVENAPNWIEVDPGVDLGNGISAGMTYNEIKARCDGSIYVKFPWKWLVCADVNGRQCCFEIEELNDEEREILGDRLDSYVEQSADDAPKADASDIDPVTTYGIIFSWERMDKEEWAEEHYKADSKHVQTTAAPKKNKKAKAKKTTTTAKVDNVTKTETTTTTAVISEPETSSIVEFGQPVGHIDMTPDEIFSMSIDELKALSGYDYDIVESKWSPHHTCYGYRFAAFPEYVCAIDAFQNPDEASIINTYHVENAPNWIEVDPGVDLGNGISAGMTYNEIKARCDGSIYVKFPWKWLVCADVNGRQCCFEIEELNDEEREILGDRLDSYVEQSADDAPKADASDIDPVTTYGLIFNY